METSAASRPVPSPRFLPGSARLLRLAPDERLVAHVRAGSQPAFEAIYDRYHRGILSFSRHMLASAEEAEDAVQHTFMAAYRDLVSSHKDIQLRAWLYTIARNRCLSVLRARRERPMGELDEPSTEHLANEVERRQDLRDLLSDLSGLPEEQRAALVLAEIGDVSHDEIALVLDVPREKVKALVFQARTSLIASRQARDTPCQEIREQLANLRGGSLRRTNLRRHLRGCAGCRDFRDEVCAQRKALAVLLPVIPTLMLKKAALASAFGGGGAAAAGGVAAGGGSIAAVGAASGGGALAAKALVVVALVGAGTAAGVSATRHATPPARSSSHHAAPAAPAATSEPELRGDGKGTRSEPTDRDNGRNGDSTKPGTRTQTRTRSRGAKARRRGLATAPGQRRKGQRHSASRRAKAKAPTQAGAPTQVRKPEPRGRTSPKHVRPKQPRRAARTPASSPKKSSTVEVAPVPVPTVAAPVVPAVTVVPEVTVAPEVVAPASSGKRDKS